MLDHKPIIGIAGGIGAGKSAVAKALVQLGCVVSHSDHEARAALRDPVIRDTLVAWWGDDILDTAGAVDRAVVAQIVFEDPDQRRRLEALTHPWIEARRRELFEDAPAESPALVIDAPLLFETGLDHQCDAVIFVDAPRELRLRRVVVSRGWDDAELSRREESQLPLDEKRSRADYVLQNDGEMSDLVDQVHPVLSRIVESCRT
jgi:dephospho-CoA kinase